MMKQNKQLTSILILISCLGGLCAGRVYSQATIRLNQLTLMHEMRETPSPGHGASISQRNVMFLWPLQYNTRPSASLDGLPHGEHVIKPDPNKINYKVRYATDPQMKRGVITASSSFPFYYPQIPLSAGTWYWQYAYINNTGEKWSDVIAFEIKENPNRFAPPAYQAWIKDVPATHPRILLFSDEWDTFVEKNKDARERQWYIERANTALNIPIVTLDEAIDTSKVGGLDNIVKRNALLTRESRRIVDREEINIEALVRAYLLTKDVSYSQAAMRRINEFISWKNSPYLKGDFNEATLLSISSMAYDSFYGVLTKPEKQMLLHEIKDNGNKIFNGFANRLENHIADNHNWQMNLRIFTMAAFAVYGELPEAQRWTEYAYNVWLARFPGLNEDGGWHNGDSYFHVNLRTLIEVPYFYSKLTGYDFFSDPWYKGSAMYVIYQQPPFSKSGGNGSSHQTVLTPRGTRVGYADALARLTGHVFAADYVRTIEKAEPDVLKTGFMAKPGDLSWFRLRTALPLPSGEGLHNLPLSYVFPQTGLATFMSDWNDLHHNAMLTFRSSPFGSTSHALANQNAFNTFYAGKPLFYSSGHHISFTDEHSIYSHRATRAHNTILPGGMGQRIGTEGYGWISRYYTGKQISYVLGDASNAYGEVVSPLWIERGRVSGLAYTPLNGWDKNRLNTFRRHIVQLGGADLIFIYDELEADTAVTWDYLLHSVENPMTVDGDADALHIRATNAAGVSDAYLFASAEMQTTVTDQFFYPAVNWLRADDSGNFAAYKNHWHFKATTPKMRINRFATIISTHAVREDGLKPERLSDDVIKIGAWMICLNLSDEGKASFSITHEKEDLSVSYNDKTRIREHEVDVELADELPELEI